MSKDMEDVKSIIVKSGNAFHSQVLKYLSSEGWTVLISPYYHDNVSNKPREIDLVAEKAFDIKSGVNEFLGTVNVKLFIECKYVSQKTVFWFHNKDKQKAEDLIIRTTRLPKNDRFTEKHHYLGGVNHVAKLFADEGKKSADNELFYKALNQSLNAMVYYRDRESILQSDQHQYIKQTVNYPVIVCNSFEKLYRVDMESDDNPLNIDDNFQIEVSYAYMDSNGKNRNEYFLIDILGFTFFDRFLKKIKNDTGLISSYLRFEGIK